MSANRRIAVVAASPDFASDWLDAMQSLATTSSREIEVVFGSELVDDADLGSGLALAHETLHRLHHELTDGEPLLFDSDWHAAWRAFREWSTVVATQLADRLPDDAIALLQDTDLALVAPRLRDRRPDVAIVSFVHTAFAAPTTFGRLPDIARDEILLGLLASQQTGFNGSIWRDAFDENVRHHLGVRPQTTFVATMAPSIGADENIAAEIDGLEAERLLLRAEVGEDTVIAIVDQLGGAANITRSLWAVDELLASIDPEDPVPSTIIVLDPTGVPPSEQTRLDTELLSIVEDINARWRRAEDHHPIRLRITAQPATALATLERADILLANPIRAGLPMTVLHGGLRNERDGLVLISESTGLHTELGGIAFDSHPYDVSATAAALSHAIDTGTSERLDRSYGWRDIASSRTAQHWLDDQLDGLEDT